MPINITTEIAKRISKSKMLELGETLAACNFDKNELIDLTFHTDNDIAFRAAWLLEIMVLKYPLSFIPYLTPLIPRFKTITNPSCMRHYAKLLTHLTSPRIPQRVRSAMHETDLEPAVEQCFDWLIDVQVPVAVKAHASEALFNMRLRYPWIADELPAQLEYLMKDGSPAIQSRGKKLLGFLEPH